jgi:CubicO group peptidase (beta-lactamase class C family)
VRVYKVPGTSWQYSGGGYTVMEQLVEDVTGLPFEEVVRDRVLEPAGMRLSTYAQPLPRDRWVGAADDAATFGHSGSNEGFRAQWTVYRNLVVTVRPGEGVLLVDVPSRGTSTVHADAVERDTFFDVEDGRSLVFERDEGGAVAALSAGSQTRLVKIQEEG